jgi:hypothetical protein
MPIDPGIELLPDVPIAGPADDLLGHAPLAERLVELACASPAATPRVIGLVGTAGIGKTSVLHLAGLLLAERPEVATVAIDAGDHGTADATLAAMTATVHEVFKSGGVVEAADAARDALARYGEVVSTAVRLAGVKVDVAGAVQRSAASARAELVENAQQLGKRVVIVIDHLDRLVERELAAAVGALRVFAQIPYLGFIVAYDRRALASRALDPAALARLIHVELAVPAVDRVLLARLVAGGLARAAERLGRTIDPILPLLDPDATTGLGLALCETPRDGKRLVNTLAAVLPLLSDADLRRAALDAAVRLVAPILDGPRLAPVPLQQRAERAAELRARIAAHPLAAPLGAAIDALVAS